jgi:hypothetical protein
MVDDESARETDRIGLGVLDEATCQLLLAETPIGRVVFIADDGQPMALPVNYLFIDGTIVFRTLEGQKLSAASIGQRVAFEVDDWDPRKRSGWSIVVKGRAEEVTQWAEAEHLEQKGLVPWAHGAWRTLWVRITPDGVTGRRN